MRGKSAIRWCCCLQVTKLNTLELLLSEALIDSYINHDKFVSMNDVLREYNEMKIEMKHPEDAVEYLI